MHPKIETVVAKIMKNRTLIVSAVLMLFSTVSQASTTFLTADITGTPLTVTGVNGNTTAGSDMVGLIVAVHFSTGATATVPFAATCGANCGQSSGSVPGGGV